MNRSSRLGLSSDSLLLINAVQQPEYLRELPLSSWDRLLRLARSSNLIGRIAESVHALGLAGDLPTQVRPHLAAIRMLSHHQRQAIQWEIRHLGEALHAIDAPMILLKGAAYAAADLDVARGRLFGDVDLLVPLTYLAHAEAALMLKGWGSEGLDPYDQRYYRQWMHEIPPMVHRKRGTVVDLHHNILPLTARNCPDIDLFIKDRVSSPIPGFAVLSPVDMVLHSATHLFYESELKNGLRDLFDLDALIRQFSAEDQAFWSRLVERARRIGLSRPLLLAMSVLRDTLDSVIPEDAYREVRSAAKLSHVEETLLIRIYNLALQPAHPLIDSAGSEFCRFAVFVRGHYLRMPLGLLIPHLARKLFGRLFKSSNRS